MEQSRVLPLEGIGVTAKRRRSQASRRPRPETLSSHPEQSPKSSTPVSDETSKFSSDENICDGNSGGKMFNLSQCVSRSLLVSGSDNGSSIILSNGMSDGVGSENKLKKVKLKVGGMTRTFPTSTSSNGTSGSGSSVKANQFSDHTRLRHKLIAQESSDEYHSPPPDRRRGLQGIPWKDFSRGSFSIRKEDMGRASARNVVDEIGDKSDSVRKNKRAPQRRVMDEEFDEDDEDAEIRYLEKLKTSKLIGLDIGRPNRDAGKFRSGDMDYEEEEEPLSDGEPDSNKRKKQKKDPVELPTENKREIALTNRQRALLSKNTSSPSGTSQIEFPNGLPPAPPRKQKEKLSEVELQLKKAEAAQRRKMQNEKADRESEAEAIRKILGQDSSRKKREEKIKKRQEEMAQEKAAYAQMLASNTIRTVMGPNGTTVTFPQEMGLPSIFVSKPYSYPAPREKCAGPSCTNAYKYRDSKSKLPLCSLQCYKAINEKLQTENIW